VSEWGKEPMKAVYYAIGTLRDHHSLAPLVSTPRFVSSVSTADRLEGLLQGYQRSERGAWWSPAERVSNYLISHRRERRGWHAKGPGETQEGRSDTLRRSVAPGRPGESGCGMFK
jgi:hypothetical protein